MILALPLALALAGCSHKTQKTVSVPASTGETAQELPTVMKEGQPAAMMPKATAFRMTGDYADHVAVTIGDGGRLTYGQLGAAGDRRWLVAQPPGSRSRLCVYQMDFHRIPRVEKCTYAG